MDEPADRNSQVPLEAEGEAPVSAEADTAARASIVAAIPTVAQSQPLPRTAEADTPQPEHAPANERAAGGAEVAPEPAIPTPDAEAPASEPVAEAPAAPLAPKVEDPLGPHIEGQTGDGSDGQPAELVVAHSHVPETEPAAAAPALYSPATQDAQIAPVTEELVWSSPEEVAPQTSSSADGPPQLLAATGLEVLARAPHSGRAQTDQTVPADTVAAVPDRAVWTMTLAPAGPAAAIPSPSTSTARDLLPYLRLAGQVAGAAVLTLAAIVLLLVVVYRWVDPPTSTLMLGQRLIGTQIEQTWVPLERISPNLVHAVIVSEDSGFCRHRGVDWAALGEAIESDRGGSTITMQVVKNLFLWPARSYVRKALEIVLAYLVEAVWPKQRVLEIYLNIAEWGPGIFGAEAAARHHFGKPAARLTAHEAALLAVALPNPIEREPGYPGYQHRRLADNLLTRMRVSRTSMRCVRPLRSGS